MKKPFYEKNNYLLKSKYNMLYKDIAYMTYDEFEKWMVGIKKFIVDIWDKYGYPPTVGVTEREIIQNFKKLMSYNVKKFQVLDDFNETCILNNSYIGIQVNQWFPNKLKTKINVSTKRPGYSLYDKLTLDKQYRFCHKIFCRNLKRDSFYNFSRKLKKTNSIYPFPTFNNAKEWIQYFEKNKNLYPEYDYWIQSSRVNDKKLLSFDDNVYTLSKEELDEILDIIPPYKLNNIIKLNSDKGGYGYSTDLFYIRVFNTKALIFPVAFVMFRTSLSQYVCNFPPLVAKYLYEKYTEHIKDQKEPINIYDPSAGWGGRILGAMSVKDDRKIHYIGTDPNSDNFFEKDGKICSKYEQIADFFNNNKGTLPGFSYNNTYDIFQLGSEVIQFEPRFQKYKGKLDLVFTSPPYFAKEGYSLDKEQSCHKYTSYEYWRDGFLYETLKTAYEWLKPNRYLLWNIANVRFDGKTMPLEEDSKKILESLGMKYIGMEKMILSKAPGNAHVSTTTGRPATKNSTKINGSWNKFEPIFIWLKQ